MGNECSGRSNQVHNAGLMKCLRVDRFDGFRHALQAICNGNEDVFYASSLEAVEYGRPEACSFVLSDPHAQNLARTIGSYTDPQMHRHVLDGGSAADLDAKSIEECYGIQAIQRSVLPLLDILQDSVRNSADVVRADADAVEVLNESLNVTGAHSTGVHGNDLLVDLPERAVVLGHDNGIESVLSIARDIQAQRAKLCLQSLLTEAVTLVGGGCRGDCILLVRRRFSGFGAAQVGIHLPLKHCLNKALGEGLNSSGKGFRPQGLPGFAKLLNVLLDMKVQRVGRFPTIGSFLGSRVHGGYPYSGLRLSHGHKIHDSLQSLSIGRYYLSCPPLLHSSEQLALALPEKQPKSYGGRVECRIGFFRLGSHVNRAFSFHCFRLKFRRHTMLKHLPIGDPFGLGKSLLIQPKPSLVFVLRR